MIGTPTAACSGFFYEASTGLRPGFSQHHWTILENKYIPHAGEYLDKKKHSKGWADDHPVYLREWCGRWVRSDDSLVYRYHSHNTLMASPTTMISNTSLGSTSDITMQLPLSSWLIVETTMFHRRLPNSPRCCQPTLQSESVILPTSTTSPESSNTVGLGKSIVEEFKVATGSLFTRQKKPRR